MNFSYPFIRRPVGTTLLAIGLFLVGVVAYRFLPVASLPTVEFPTIRVSAEPAGRRSDDHGGDRRRAARAPARRNPGRHRNHLVEFARQHQHHHPVRSRPQHRRRRARRAGRAQRRAHRPARRPADPADLPQGQPVGGADPDPGADLEDHDAERDLRRRRYRDRPAHRAGRGRRRRQRQRRRAAGDPRPRQSGGDRLDGREHGGRAHRDRQRQCGEPARHVRRAAAGPYHRQQRSASAPREYENIVVKTTNGTVVRLGAIAAIEQSVRNSRSAAWFNLQPSVLLIITKQADANVIETVDRIRALLPELQALDPGRHRDSRSCPTAPRPSAPASSTCS